MEINTNLDCKGWAT